MCYCKSQLQQYVAVLLKLLTSAMFSKVCACPFMVHLLPVQLRASIFPRLLETDGRCRRIQILLCLGDGCVGESLCMACMSPGAVPAAGVLFVCMMESHAEPARCDPTHRGVYLALGAVTGIDKLQCRHVLHLWGTLRCCSNVHDGIEFGGSCGMHVCS
jgi:hypothetical protein